MDNDNIPNLDVLILIVVEYGLGGVFLMKYINANNIVLILIVVEYGLGVPMTESNTKTPKCLNPYCSGIWSRR